MKGKTADQKIWQQVSVKQPEKYSSDYWLQKAAGRPKVLTHFRLNQSTVDKEMKRRMLDSTYTNPCDPNSMRDLGATRNVEYAIEIASCE